MAHQGIQTAPSFLKSHGSILLTLVIGVSLSFLMFRSEQKQVWREINTEFNQLSEDRSLAFQRVLEKKELLLEALRSLYIGSEKVEEHEFRETVGNLFGHAQSVLALAWVPRVPDAERESYEAEVRQSGVGDFRLTEKNSKGEWATAEKRPEYFPVYYVEPNQAPSLIPRGYDLASDPVIAEAIGRARQGGKVTVTGKLKPSPGTEDESGFLMFLPIGQENTGAVAAASAERKNFQGLIAGFFRFRDLIESATSVLSPRGLDFFLYDLSAPAGNQYLSFYPSRLRQEAYRLKWEDYSPPTKGFYADMRLQVGGREWLVICRPISSFSEFGQLWYPFLLLGLGLSLTGVLCFYFYYLNRSQKKLRDEIIQREKSEEDGRSQRKLFQNFISKAPLALFAVDANGILTLCEGQRLDGIGLAPSDTVGKSVYDIYPKDSKVLSGIMLALSGASDDSIIDAGNFVFHYRFSPLLGHDAKVNGAICVATDITQLRRSQLELEKSRTQLVMAQQLTGLGIWEYDPATQKTVWSEEMFRIHGLDPKGGVPPFDRLMWMIHPEDRSRWSGLIEEIAKTGLSKRFEFRIIRPDGEWRWILSHEGAQLHIDGRPARFYGTLLDITELRETEKALREQEAILHAIASSAQDAVIMMNHEGHISFWNDAAERILGWTKEEAKGQVLHYFIAPERYRAGYQHAFPHFQITGEGAAVGKTLELTALKKDKTEIPVELSLSAISIGGQWHAIGILRDITERKRLQGQLLHAQKMESVGRLAGGIAHDFNNLITVISGYDEYLLAQLDPQSIEYSVAKDIKAASDRAADLTKRLLAFSRRQIIQPRIVDLNDLISSLTPMLRRLIREDIDYAVVPAADLGKVEVDPGQMEQVLTNLVVNASDAMPSGGNLVIKTENVFIDPSYADRGGTIAKGDYVMVSVSDTGTGMSDEVKEHLFEPFFTTKEKGRGTGLGLATVYGIVQQNKGHITVHSKVGRGTSIQIYLAQAKGISSDAGEKPAVPAGASRGKETVLFVEDEKLVRELAVRVLKEFGYDVLSASNGEDALRVIEEFGDKKIHLLATDVVMPHMGGKELADHVRWKYPHIKILYLSGYADDILLRQDIISRDVSFLQKPFSRWTLTQKIRAVLDGKDTRG